MTADQVIAAFQAAGLEAANPTVMGPKDYGLAPKLCDGRRFLIPSLGPDLGGHVFACKSLADRDRLAKFYQDAGRASAVFFSWVYVKGNIVVQLSGTLNGSTALKYEAAIP